MARWTRSPLVALGVVLAAMGAAHGPRLARNLDNHHWEDWRFFRHNKAQIASVADCFTHPSAWPGLYRPVSTNLYYYLGRRLFGTRVEGYHVVNALVYAANALLLFFVARRLLPDAWALLPPLLYASRAAHQQVVCFTSEFQVLSSVFFTLAATLLFVEGRVRERRGLELAALLPFALALLCKETAAVWPLILLAGARLLDRPGAWRRCLPAFVVAAAWAGMFTLARQAVGGGEPTGFGYDVSAAVLSRAAAHLLAFSNLLAGSPTLDTPLPPRIEALSQHPAVVAALAVLVLAEAAVLLRRPRAAPLRAAAFGFAWFLLGAAPFLFFEDRLFTRYGYFAHAGLALSVPALLWWAAAAVRVRGLTGPGWYDGEKSLMSTPWAPPSSSS
ncbi:MAG TPA: hypothetical protein VF310_13965 [Vicinamibacteria bacterium]